MVARLDDFHFNRATRRMAKVIAKIPPTRGTFSAKGSGGFGAGGLCVTFPRLWVVWVWVTVVRGGCSVVNVVVVLLGAATIRITPSWPLSL